MYPQVPSPQAAGPARPIVWPYVLGGVSMVLAGEMMVGLAYAALQLISAIFTGGPLGLGAFLSSPYGAWQMVQLGFQVLRPVLGAVLLAAGWLTYRHQRLGRTLHRAFAAPAILLAAAYPIGYILTCPPQFRMQMVLWPLWSSTLAAVYPVFLLVWFARPAVRQYVDGWGR